MRVLAGPRVDLELDQIAGAAARALAGPEGTVTSLRDVGVTNLSRPLSRAEIALLREALRGEGPGGGAADAMDVPAQPGSGAEDGAVVGYVCRGTLVGLPPAAANGAAPVVVVTDHADLTWRSPLIGPNDPSVGPRFPSVTGVYSYQVVLDRLAAVEGMIVIPGVVAGVRADTWPTAYEAGMAATQGHVAVSSELTPVVVVAAHMGLRVAAALVPGPGDG
jgi:hypothetical protein